MNKQLFQGNNSDYDFETIINRLEAELIADFLVTTKVNHPIFKIGDLLHLRQSVKYEKKDFIVYKIQEEIFIRRLIKMKENKYYIAGDNEKAYRIISKNDIIGKVLARERGNKLVILSKKNKSFYTFNKMKFVGFRTKNRIVIEDEAYLNQSFEQAVATIAKDEEVVKKDKIDVNVDHLLKGFLDPNELALNPNMGNEENLEGFTEEELEEEMRKILEEESKQA